MIILVGILFILSAIAYWKKIPYSFDALLFSLSSVFMIAVNFSLLFRFIKQPFEYYYGSIEGQLLLLVWCFTTLDFFWNSKSMSRLFSAIMIFIVLKLVSSLSIELYIPDDFIVLLKPKWLGLSNSIMIVSYGFLIFGSFLSTILFIYMLVFLLKEPILRNTEGGNIKFFTEIPISQLVTIFNSEFNKDKKAKITELTENEISKKLILLELAKNVNEIAIEKKEKREDLFDQLSTSELRTSLIKTKIISRRERRVLFFDKVSTRLIAIGHISLTSAILMGAIGMKEISGVYWSWNTKEIWSLIIWLIFTLYLHVWLIRKGGPFQKSTLGCIAFSIIWISYFYVLAFLKG